MNAKINFLRKRWRFGICSAVPTKVQAIYAINVRFQHITGQMGIILHFNGHFPGEPGLAGVY